MYTMEGGVPLETVAYERQRNPAGWGDYRGHDINRNGVTVATVFVYDNGKRTYEFDNAVVYTEELLKEIMEAASKLTSGKDG